MTGTVKNEISRRSLSSRSLPKLILIAGCLMRLVKILIVSLYGDAELNAIQM